MIKSQVCCFLRHTVHVIAYTVFLANSHAWKVLLHAGITDFTSLRCRWQTRATRCLSLTPTVLYTEWCPRSSVINWWPTTVTSLSHWPST